MPYVYCKYLNQPTHSLLLSSHQFRELDETDMSLLLFAYDFRYFSVMPVVELAKSK